MVIWGKLTANSLIRNPNRQPLTLLTKPQPHENHTYRFPTLATAHP
jgi:hypothetical protein